jgi:hypothetical protein
MIFSTPFHAHFMRFFTPFNAHYILLLFMLIIWDFLLLFMLIKSPKQPLETYCFSSVSYYYTKDCNCFITLKWKVKVKPSQYEINHFRMTSCIMQLKVKVKASQYELIWDFLLFLMLIWDFLLLLMLIIWYFLLLFMLILWDFLLLLTLIIFYSFSCLLYEINNINFSGYHAVTWHSVKFDIVWLKLVLTRFHFHFQLHYAWRHSKSRKSHIISMKRSRI